MTENILKWIPIATTVIALGAFIASLIAVSNTLSVAQAQLYLELRKRFAEINAKLPRDPKSGKDYHREKWFPEVDSDAEEFNIIERYWYQTFDEWFTTKILHPLRFKKLWDTFYRRAIFQGARHDAIRYVLYRMQKDRTSFSGYKSQFVKEMEDAFLDYRTEKDAKSLFDGFETEAERRERQSRS